MYYLDVRSSIVENWVFYFEMFSSLEVFLRHPLKTNVEIQMKVEIQMFYSSISFVFYHSMLVLLLMRVTKSNEFDFLFSFLLKKKAKFKYFNISFTTIVKTRCAGYTRCCTNLIRFEKTNIRWFRYRTRWCIKCDWKRKWTKSKQLFVSTVFCLLCSSIDRREPVIAVWSDVFFVFDVWALFSNKSCRIRADLALRMRLKHFDGFGISPVNIFNALRPR